MTDGSSSPRRVLHGSRLGFGVTTAALIAVASAGTGLLVTRGTNQLQPSTGRVPPPLAASPQPVPVLVDRAPGSLVAPVRQVPTTPPHRPAPASVPRLPGTSVELPPTAPPEVPPVVVPPVVAPPVVAPPPAEPPPVLGPSVRQSGKAGKAGKASKKQHPAHPDDNGKHLGQLRH